MKKFKQMIQPVEVYEDGVWRFYRNNILDDIKLTERTLPNGEYLLNVLYRACGVYGKSDKHIDDYRHFNQLIGYSVSGFGSLQIAYNGGSYDGGFDGYIHHIDSIEATEKNKLKHPISLIVETDESFSEEDLTTNNLFKFKFVGNEIMLYMRDHLGFDFEKYVNSEKYSVSDRRQLLQLLGTSLETYFNYPFNNDGNDIDYKHYVELLEEFNKESHPCYGVYDDMQTLIGKKVKTFDYEETIEWDDQAPSSTFGCIGTVIESSFHPTTNQPLFTIKFDENHSFLDWKSGACASDEFEFLRNEFDLE